MQNVSIRLGFAIIMFACVCLPEVTQAQQTYCRHNDEAYLRDSAWNKSRQDRYSSSSYRRNEDRVELYRKLSKTTEDSADIDTQNKISPTNIVDYDYIRGNDSVHDFLRSFESLRRLPVQGIVLLTQHILVQMNEYSYLARHSYNSYEELSLASGPQVNQKKCIRQLSDLVDRMHRQPDSRDLNFNQLLDTFGHAPSGQLMGNYIWPGSYRECLRLQIHSREGKLGTKYCIARIKGVDWPKEVETDSVSVQVGVCLPESCDSISYRNKHALVEQLVEYNLRQIDKDMYEVAGLYCLPDEASPLRSIWRDPYRVIAVIVATCWIGMISYASVRDYLYESNLNEETSCRSLRSSELLKSFSIIHNINRLFTTTKQQSCDSDVSLIKQTNLSPSNRSELVQASGIEKRRSNNQINTNITTSVDLDILSSIKVIAMCYVILGHVLMIVTGGVIDARQLKTNPAFLVANLSPAFAVNSFFSITGILTAYLLLKENKTSPFLASPTKWIMLTVYRYVRLMPMYLLVVLYSKFIAKYTNSGPFWDYGTSSLSHRRQCEQESAFWTLLFGANFKKPLEHCLPGGWYLANDFQFFLITPFFVYLLDKCPKIGMRVLIICAVGGYLSAVFSILGAEINDIRPIASFEPHAFKVYVTSLVYTYTRPYYRIPAYLCGLYIGHILYQYEQDKSNPEIISSIGDNPNQVSTERDWPNIVKNNCKLFCSLVIAACLIFAGSDVRLDEKPASMFIAAIIGAYLSVFILSADLLISFKATPSSKREELGQPKLFKRFSIWFSLSLMFGTYITSFIGARVTLTKSAARGATAMILPTFNLATGIAVGLIVLAAATSSTNKSQSLVYRFLTAPQWKPLARLSLSVLLVNVEVITYLADGREYLHALTNQYLWSMNLLSIVMTYIVSTFVSLLIESPLCGLIKYSMRMIVKRTGSELNLKAG